MIISLIACVNTKHAIGKNNQLLYHIPSDLANFKRLTSNSIVIMGRKTWESLPTRPLPNRKNIIITKDGLDYDRYDSLQTQELLNSDNELKFKNLTNAIEYIENYETYGTEEVFIIGGSTLYKEVLEKDIVDKIYFTEVLDDKDGDVYFPMELINDKTKWKVTFKTDPIVDPTGKNPQYFYKFMKRI